MKSILIVEDEVALREAFAMIFELQDFTVHQAENGKEALEILKNCQPEIMLLDILMPVMGGIEFLEKNQSLKRIDTSKVVVLSNLSDDRTIKKINEFGIATYILKSSIAPMSLVEKVNEIIKIPT